MKKKNALSRIAAVTALNSWDHIKSAVDHPGLTNNMRIAVRANAEACRVIKALDEYLAILGDLVSTSEKERAIAMEHIKEFGK